MHEHASVERRGRTDWVVVLPAARVAAAIANPRFQLLVTLGRLANSLSLARLPLARPLRWQSPRIRRERQAAFFYVGAVLFEGLRLVEKLASHYRNHPKWDSTFGPILADAAVQQLRSKYLKALRDQNVFHFDADAARGALRIVPPQELILVSGRGTAAQDIYFDVSDDTVLIALLGTLDPAKYRAALDEFMVGTGDLYAKFIRAVNQFAPVALRPFGAKRRRPRASDPAVRSRLYHRRDGP